MIVTNSNRNCVRAALLIGLAGPLFAQGSQTLTISAFMDIWQAGGYNDGAGADSQPPASYAFTAGPGQALSFSNVTGTWSCGNGAVPNGPDGTTSGNCLDTQVTVFNPIGPFSGLDMTDFSRPLVGMFLEDSLPTSVAPTLRFYYSDATQGGVQINFAVLSPEVGQVFFIGDGKTGTGSGAIQVFNVPPTATHLYLGYVDSCGNNLPGCYSDNSGSMSVTFALNPCNFQVSGVTPEVQLADRAWATQAGIMLSWKSGESISGLAAATIADNVSPPTSSFVTDYSNGGVSGCAQSNNCSISLSDYTNFLSRLGITVADPAPSACGLAGRLRELGPMTIVTGTPNPNLVGAAVITGITGDGTASGSSLNVLNPGTGTTASRSLEALLLSVEGAIAAGWPEFVQFP